MTCKHLRQLEAEIIAAGIRETYRGKAWTENCREWVYFDCYLDRKSIRKRMTLAECVVDHEHLGTHDGQEAGLVCIECRDGIMGMHERYKKGSPVFG